MTRPDFEEWVKYVMIVFGDDVGWTCSKYFHYEAFKEYTLAELKEATDGLYQSKETTYLMNYRKDGYGLTMLLPVINEFSKAIIKKRGNKE